MLLDLDRACLYYCGELRNENKKQRMNICKDGKYKSIWDLPKCAVACKGLRGHIYKNFSKPARSNTYDKVPQLKTELLKYVRPGGKIGDVTNLPRCGNQVGRCAEPHAAKDCMIKEPRTTLLNLKFSVALDIVAGEPMPACAICKATFPTIK